MQVTQANAVVVAAIFKALSDPRFSMRTVGAMSEGDTIEVAKILDVSAEIGLTVKRRIRDGAALIERPCTPEVAQTIAQQAMVIAQGGGEPFEVDYSQNEQGSIEAHPVAGQLPAPDSDEEDGQFS